MVPEELSRGMKFIRTSEGYNSAICHEHGLIIEGARMSVRNLMGQHNLKYHRKTYGYLMTKQWVDPEPEVLSLALRMGDDLEQFVSFTTSSAWMDKAQVEEIRDFLNDCLDQMD